MSARLLFFTGGTALADLSRELAKRDIFSVHLVTTFDSGGSSARLRQAFALPALGDLRNRLLALADPRQTPRSVIELCASRLPEEAGADAARVLESLGSAKAPLWEGIPPEYARVLKRNLNFFLQRMTPGFNSAGACLGNLFLAGAYLEHGRDFAPALAVFHNLFHCRGTVLPIVDESLYLGARLSNGGIIVGQHLFRKLPAPVSRIFLTVHEHGGPEVACRPPLLAEARSCIRSASLICYPTGSFYSSVLANLLPSGVGRAVAASKGGKVFVPNSGHDPELCGLDLPGQAAAILACLQMDAPEARPEYLLRHVLVDSRNGRYPGGLGPEIMRELARMGLNVIDRDLVCPNDARRHEPRSLLRALLDLEAHG